MKKINTLKKNYEFSNVIKRGNYHVKKQIIVYITKNNKNKNIIGIAISTKLCNAVNRNKIKRIIRESYYREMKKIKQGYNIVFLWNKKEPIENICFQEVHKEIEEIFKETKKRKRTRRQTQTRCCQKMEQTRELHLRHLEMAKLRTKK